MKLTWVGTPSANAINIAAMNVTQTNDLGSTTPFVSNENEVVPAYPWLRSMLLSQLHAYVETQVAAMALSFSGTVTITVVKS
jgi:hypothetical protein